MKQPKIAIVYDWLTTEHGGAERVLKAFADTYPLATFYTSIYDQTKSHWASHIPIRTTFLQRLPSFLRKHRLLAPLMPLAFENLDLHGYDVVISVTSAFAKTILTLPSQLHVCYLLTPPRFLYSHSEDYSIPKMIQPLLLPVTRYLRFVDKITAHRPDVIVPISLLVKKRAETIYNLTTTEPIYPPIDQIQLQTSITNLPKLSLPQKYYCVVSRLVRYKHVEIALQACQKLQRTIVIVGTGPEEKRLKKLVAKNPNSQVLFLKNLTDAQLQQVYSRAQAVLQVNIEDFGIAVLEAQSLGVPVIVHAESGATELLKHQKHAIVIKEMTVPAVVAALQQIERTDFDAKNLIKNMRKYDTNMFSGQFRELIAHYWHK